MYINLALNNTLICEKLTGSTNNCRKFKFIKENAMKSITQTSLLLTLKYRYLSIKTQNTTKTYILHLPLSHTAVADALSPEPAGFL